MIEPDNIIVSAGSKRMANGMVFIFDNGLPDDVKVRFFDDHHHRSKFPDGRVKQNLVLHSDEQSEIIGSYVRGTDEKTARLILVKTRSADEKQRHWDAAKQPSTPPEDFAWENNICSFKPDDVKLVSDILHKLHVSLSAEDRQEMVSALGLSSRTHKSVPLERSNVAAAGLGELLPGTDFGIA